MHVYVRAECVRSFFSPKKLQTNITSWADVAERCSKSITCMQAAQDALLKAMGGGSSALDEYKVCLNGIPGNGQSVAQCESTYKISLTSSFSNILKQPSLKLDLSSGGTRVTACKHVIASCSHELSMSSHCDACPLRMRMHVSFACRFVRVLVSICADHRDQLSECPNFHSHSV